MLTLLLKTFIHSGEDENVFMCERSYTNLVPG